MTDLKTKKTTKSVREYINSIKDPERKEDCKLILELMERISGSKPSMWGDSIVGFGTIYYKRSTGKEYEWFKVGFSSRQAALTLYAITYIKGFQELVESLGKVKYGKSCIYIKKLKDIDMKKLEKLIKLVVNSDQYGCV